MSWTDIHLGDYGFVGRLTLTEDGTAVNISTYTTKEFVIEKPDETTMTVDADFATNGTDGILEYVFADGDIDQAGLWTVRAIIEKTGVHISSAKHKFAVQE